MTIIGAVAAVGIAKNRGERNRLSVKQLAITNAVNPVRPPSATPVALSTYVVTVLQPRQAPVIVAMASLSMMFRM